MSAKRFVTKRVEIDAIQFLTEDVLNVVKFTQSGDGIKVTTAFNYGFDHSDGDYVIWGEVYDKLHDTWIKVYEGQWIIKGNAGEYYPCDNDTFLWKYEEV